MRRIGSLLTVVWHNRELRRVELAYAGFTGAELAVWVAMLVYTYQRGGADAAGLAAAVQLIPAALTAPLAARLADRMGAARALTAGYVLQSVAMAGAGVVLLVSGPLALAIAAAALAASAVTVTRPAQAVLLPALAHRPDELTAATVVAGWTESVAWLAAPALAGVLIGIAGPGSVFVVFAVSTAAAAAAVHPISGPPPAVAAAPEARPPAAVRDPAARLLVGLIGAEFAALGMLDVLCVALAIRELELGSSGAGYLNALFGLGGALGIAVTATFVGRARLLGAVGGALTAWTAAFALLAIRPTVAVAVVALTAAGAARVTVDVAGRTLLQRTAPTAALAQIFGVLEAVQSAALAAGSLAAPVLIALFGVRGAVLGAGLILPLLALAGGRGLLSLDRRANVPVVEIALLRRLPIFAALPAPQLEAVAFGLSCITTEPGTRIVTGGEIGDRYYAIASGTVEVLTAAGDVASTLERGEGFGEIALLRERPRTATVRARTPTALYALEKGPFIDAVTGHSATGQIAAAIAAARTPGQDSAAASRSV